MKRILKILAGLGLTPLALAASVHPKTTLCRQADGTSVRFKPREFETGVDASKQYWLIRSNQPREKVAVTRESDATGTRFVNAKGETFKVEIVSSFSRFKSRSQTHTPACREVYE